MDAHNGLLLTIVGLPRVVLNVFVVIILGHGVGMINLKTLKKGGQGSRGAGVVVG